MVQLHEKSDPRGVLRVPGTVRWFEVKSPSCFTAADTRSGILASQVRKTRLYSVPGDRSHSRCRVRARETIAEPSRSGLGSAWSRFQPGRGGTCENQTWSRGQAR